MIVKHPIITTSSAHIAAVETWTVVHIVKSYPGNKFEGGHPALHIASDSVATPSQLHMR